MVELGVSREAGRITVSKARSPRGRNCRKRQPGHCNSLKVLQWRKCWTLWSAPPCDSSLKELRIGCLVERKRGAPQELKIVQSDCKGWGAVVGGEGGQVGRGIKDTLRGLGFVLLFQKITSSPPLFFSGKTNL